MTPPGPLTTATRGGLCYGQNHHVASGSGFGSRAPATNPNPNPTPTHGRNYGAAFGHTQAQTRAPGRDFSGSRQRFGFTVDEDGKPSLTLGEDDRIVIAPSEDGNGVVISVEKPDAEEDGNGKTEPSGATTTGPQERRLRAARSGAAFGVLGARGRAFAAGAATGRALADLHARMSVSTDPNGDVHVTHEPDTELVVTGGNEQVTAPKFLSRPMSRPGRRSRSSLTSNRLG